MQHNIQHDDVVVIKGDTIKTLSIMNKMLRDINKQADDRLNAKFKEFQPRINSAVIDNIRIKEQATIEREESYIE